MDSSRGAGEVVREVLRAGGPLALWNGAPGVLASAGTENVILFFGSAWFQKLWLAWKRGKKTGENGGKQIKQDPGGNEEEGKLSLAETFLSGGVVGILSGGAYFRNFFLCVSAISCSRDLTPAICILNRNLKAPLTKECRPTRPLPNIVTSCAICPSEVMKVRMQA